MKYTNKFLSALLLSTSFVALQGAAGRDIKTDIKPKTGVATCTAEGQSCSVAINAVGDVVEMDVSQLEVNNLGTISSEKKVVLDLPGAKGDTNLYALTPTAGESKGDNIYIAFRNQVQAPGSRLAGMEVIKIYRLLPGQKSNEWVEVGEITSNVRLATADVTLNPDGTATTKNPTTGDVVVFNIGKKVLN